MEIINHTGQPTSNPTDQPTSQPTRYFLGVDVGGTKSHALIADEMGQVLGFGVGGRGNPDSVGLEGLAEVLEVITRMALKEAGLDKDALAGAGFGVGGYDWPDQRNPILATIRTLNLNAPLDLVNDAMIAMLAGTTEGWGLGVVAGTGCNCWGWNRARRIGQMTGHGARMAEGAGASELVLKAVQAVALAWTWRGPPTRLTEAFVDLTETEDVVDFLARLTTGRIHVGAKAAPLVFQVAAAGDPVAQELIVWAGRELGSLALGVIRQLDLQAESFEVVLAGSFYKGSPLIIETMRRTIHTEAPGAHLVRLQAPPVVGGVVLAMAQAGLAATAVRERLITATAALM